MYVHHGCKAATVTATTMTKHCGEDYEGLRGLALGGIGVIGVVSFCSNGSNGSRGPRETSTQGGQGPSCDRQLLGRTHVVLVLQGFGSLTYGLPGTGDMSDMLHH